MLMRGHIVLPGIHTFIHWRNGPYLPFISQLQNITAVWLILISHSTEGRRLNWPKWLKHANVVCL